MLQKVVETFFAKETKIIVFCLGKPLDCFGNRIEV